MEEPKDKVYRSRKSIILDNFFGGIAWGLGTLVGASLIIGLIGFLLSKINFIPLIGSWVAQVIEVVNQYSVK